MLGVYFFFSEYIYIYSGLEKYMYSETSYGSTQLDNIQGIGGGSGGMLSMLW